MSVEGYQVEPMDNEPLPVESAAESSVESSAGSEVEPELSEVEPDLSGVEPELPEAVRLRVIALAASAITGFPAEELPAQLRRVARFAPNRRARLGPAPIAAQLASDLLFRQRIAARVVADAGELGTAVSAGTRPAAADPVEVAALAY